jgi:hypothetical protein
VECLPSFRKKQEERRKPMTDKITKEEEEMKNTIWNWSVDAKTGKQTLVIPKKGGFSFEELMHVQMAACDFLKTVQGLILGLTTGKAPDGSELPSKRRPR